MGLFNFVRKRDDAPEPTTTNTTTETTSPPVSDVLLQALLNGEDITKEQALTIPAVSGAVDLISNMIASMPVKLYKYKQGKVETVEGDPRVSMLNGDTRDTLDAFQMKKAMVQDYLLDKGGYCYIRRSRNDVTGLFYVEPIYVSPIPNYRPIFKDYYIVVEGGTYKPYEFIKLLRNTKNGAYGTGLTQEVGKTLETAFNTLLYQLNMVKSGGNKKGFLKSQKKLGQEEINALKRAWYKLFSNNTENVVVLNNGLEFQESSNNAVEMQMNENKKTFNDEINNLFHIYPNDFYRTFKEAIYPIIKAFTTSLNRDLLLEKEKKNLYFDFDVKEIIKANVKERMEALRIAKEIGLKTINEMRREENLNYIEGMDVINVGLGAVLYDINTQKYYTPNTDTVGSMEEDSEYGLDEYSATETGENEENVFGNVDENMEDNIKPNLEEDTFDGETLEGNEENNDTEIDDILNNLELELVGENDTENRAYKSKYYDPAKAHQYYEQHKKLTGRKSTKNLNEKGKAAARYVKEKLKAEKQKTINAHKEAMNKKIEELREKYKSMSREERKQNREQIYNEIRSLRQENRQQISKIRNNYENKYQKELDKIKSDKKFQKPKKKK